MTNSINWGRIYSSSWFGNVNELNSWGIVYPFDAPTILVFADTTKLTSDLITY